MLILAVSHRACKAKLVLLETNADRFPHRNIWHIKLHPYCQTIDGVIFGYNYNSARLHYTTLVCDFCQLDGLNTVEQQGVSSDLNPIKNECVIFGCVVANPHCSITNPYELRRTFAHSGSVIWHELLENLVISIWTRVEAVIGIRKGQNEYKGA